MNPYLIKMIHSRTIDRNRPYHRNCPDCGSVLCHVKENDTEIFCINTFCSFHDFLSSSYYEEMIQKVHYEAKYQFNNIYFSINPKYKNYTHPFISKEDYKSGQYIVRDAEIDNAKLNDSFSKYMGLTPGMCVKKDSKIIARYSTIELLVKDGWIPNHDVEIK